MSVCAKFKRCAAKTVGEVGFLRVTGFSKKHYYKISPDGCQYEGTDFKLGKHDMKWSMMLHYKFDKVWQNIFDSTVFLI